MKIFIVLVTIIFFFMAQMNDSFAIDSESTVQIVDMSLCQSNSSKNCDDVDNCFRLACDYYKNPSMYFMPIIQLSSSACSSTDLVNLGDDEFEGAVFIVINSTNCDDIAYYDCNELKQCSEILCDLSNKKYPNTYISVYFWGSSCDFY